MKARQKVRVLLTFEVGSFVYIGTPSLAVLVSMADKVVTALYNRLMTRVFRLYEMVTVNDKSLSTIKEGIENSISIHRAS